VKKSKELNMKQNAQNAVKQQQYPSSQPPENPSTAEHVLPST